MSIEHGTGLRLADGDLVFGNGALETVSGTENLIQALTLRVLTPFGGDPYDVRYGFDAAAVLTGSGDLREVVDLLRLNLVKTLATEPRIADVQEVQVTDTPGSERRTWRVRVAVVAADGAPVALGLELGGGR
jgi:hypothetical protein